MSRNRCTFASVIKITLAEKTYKNPSIVWLKVTDYMHAWLQYELGGASRISEQRVVSVQHIPGARAVLKMETEDDVMESRKVVNAMSATRHNCLVCGLDLDPDFIGKTFGVTKAGMKLFVPIECPKMCLTKHGVLRPWTLDISLGREQASALQRLLRHEFWKAVDTFNLGYARKMGGKRYPQVEMIEAFCQETGTPDIFVDAMRREWQRRVKRGETTTPPPPEELEHMDILEL